MSGFDTTSFFMRKETTPLPVLRENKQGILPYAIAFWAEPGMLNLQETFLKQVLLLVSFSHPISCPQTPYTSSSHEKDKHVKSHFFTIPVK